MSQSIISFNQYHVILTLFTAFMQQYCTVPLPLLEPFATLLRVKLPFQKLDGVAQKKWEELHTSRWKKRGAVRSSFEFDMLGIGERLFPHDVNIRTVKVLYDTCFSPGKVVLYH